MENENIVGIDYLDDTGLLYAAIYSDFEMAQLLSEVADRIDAEDMSDALYYAAMKKKEELMSLVR